MPPKREHKAKAPVAPPPPEEPVVPTLLDVVAGEMLEGRHPERPVLSRVFFVGEIVAKDDPPKQFFEDVVSRATQAVNDRDPLGGRLSRDSTDVVTVTGVFVEMQHHFVQLLESEPAHIIAALSELHDRLHVKKSCEAIRNVHIVMISDDVVKRSTAKWMALDASVTARSLTKPLEEHIVDAAHALMQLGSQVATQVRVQQEQSVAAAKTTMAATLPSALLVETCIKSGACLSLPEYVELFGKVPVVTRPSEEIHPVEPPLNY